MASSIPGTNLQWSKTKTWIRTIRIRINYEKWKQYLKLILVHSEYRKSTVTDQHSNSWMVIWLNVLTFWVTCSDVRYEFRIKMMFGSSSPPVVCRRGRVLFTLVVFVCKWWCQTHNVLFLFCLTSSFVLHTVCCQFPWSVYFWLPCSVFSNGN